MKQAREELQTAKDNLEIVKEGITKNSASFSSTLIRSTTVSYTHRPLHRFRAIAVRTPREKPGMLRCNDETI